MSNNAIIFVIKSLDCEMVKIVYIIEQIKQLFYLNRVIIIMENHEIITCINFILNFVCL